MHAQIGPKGVGKSVLAHHFAQQAEQPIDIVPIYRDMTTRDLFQRRNTSPQGDTNWQPTPLVMAALEGRICVLDGIDRLDVGAGTAAPTHLQSGIQRSGSLSVGPPTLDSRS